MGFSVTLIPATPGRTLLQENAYAAQRSLDNQAAEITTELDRIAGLNGPDRLKPANLNDLFKLYGKLLRVTQAVEYLALVLVEAGPGELSDREVLLKFLRGVTEYEKQEGGG